MSAKRGSFPTINSLCIALKKIYDSYKVYHRLTLLTKSFVIAHSSYNIVHLTPYRNVEISLLMHTCVP